MSPIIDDGQRSVDPVRRRGPLGCAVNLPGTHKFDLQSTVGLLNFYYDFGQRGHFSPYVGAGIGFVRHKTSNGTINGYFDNPLGVRQRSFRHDRRQEHDAVGRRPDDRLLGRAALQHAPRCRLSLPLHGQGRNGQSQRHEHRHRCHGCQPTQSTTIRPSPTSTRISSASACATTSAAAAPAVSAADLPHMIRPGVRARLRTAAACRLG